MPIARLVSLLAITSLLLSPVARADDAPAPATATGTAPPTMTTSSSSLTASEGVGLRIVVFAMGQADSMLIVGPRKSVLIDCGAPLDRQDKKGFEHVKDTIVKLTGAPRVDDVIVTHFHSDHVGDAPDSEHFASGFWGLFAAGVSTTAILDHGGYPSFGEESHPHQEWLKWLPKWKEKGVYQTRATPRVGDVIELGGAARIRVVAVNGNEELAKAAKDKKFEGKTRPNENDYSIAVVISCGNFSMYTGGDLSGQDFRAHTGGARTKRHDAYTDVETSIKDRVGNVEILRCDHHGSSHSTNDEFVKTLRPEVTLISCGQGNSFKHPDKEVVERAQEFGPVFVTSGLANTWSGEADAPKVEGEMTISVAADGSIYFITGKDGEIFRGKGFSAEEEKKGLDHPEMAKTKP